jgi:hypothetical protein
VREVDEDGRDQQHCDDPGDQQTQVAQLVVVIVELLGEVVGQEEGQVQVQRDC